VGGAVDRARREAPWVEAVGRDDEAAGVEAQQLGGARDLSGREHQQALAARGPAAHPPQPRLRVRPARVGAADDLLEHQQLGAVQVAEHRHPGSDACRGLVQRREVMQVQEVRTGRVDPLQRARPGHDVLLVGGVVHGGEDGVGRARAVLVGRMHRRVSAGEVDGAHVEARVEGSGVAEAGKRAREDRDVPAVRRQRPRQRARHVRRAAAREEHEAADDAHPVILTIRSRAPPGPGA
jgi:hypothetical protein